MSTGSVNISFGADPKSVENLGQVVHDTVKTNTVYGISQAFKESEDLRKSYINSKNIDKDITSDERFSNYRETVDEALSLIQYDREKGNVRNGYEYLKQFPTLMGVTNNNEFLTRDVKRISEILNSFASNINNYNNVVRDLMLNFASTNKVLTDDVINSFTLGIEIRSNGGNPRTGSPAFGNKDLRHPDINRYIPFDTGKGSNHRFAVTTLDGLYSQNMGLSDDLTLFQDRTNKTINNILDWHSNIAQLYGDGADKIKSDLQESFVEDLYNDYFKGFHFFEDGKNSEAQRVKDAIRSHIANLSDFQGTYHIEDSELLHLLDTLGGFGLFTERQAREIARNKSMTASADKQGRNFNEIPIFDLMANFKRIKYGDSAVDIPDYRSMAHFPENLANVIYHPDSALPQNGYIGKLENLIDSRNSILSAVFTEGIYKGHPLSIRSGNGKYEVLPGAKEAFDKRLQDLNFWTLETDIGKIIQKILKNNKENGEQIVDDIFKSKSHWFDDGRGHYYDRRVLEARIEQKGHDGKYNLPPSHAREVFKSEIAGYLNPSKGDLKWMYGKDNSARIPIIDPTTWRDGQKQAQIFNQQIAWLAENNPKYEKLFSRLGDGGIQKLQSLFTALSFFSNDGNFIAGLRNYNEFYDKNGKPKQGIGENGYSEEAKNEIQRNLYPYLSFFGGNSTAQARILEKVFSSSNTLPIADLSDSSQKAKNVFKLFEEIVGIVAGSQDILNMPALSSLDDKKIRGAYHLAVIGSEPEKYLTSYSRKANYANSKTTSNLHNTDVRNTVYQQKEHLINSIPKYLISASDTTKALSDEDQLKAFINSVLAQRMAKREQKDLSSVFVGESSAVINAAGDLFNKISSEGSQPAQDIMSFIDNYIKGYADILEDIDNFDTEIKKHGIKVGAHNKAYKRLFKDAVLQLQNYYADNNTNIDLAPQQKEILRDWAIDKDHSLAQYNSEQIFELLKARNLDTADVSTLAVAEKNRYKTAGDRSRDINNLLTASEYQYREYIRGMLKNEKRAAQNIYDAGFGYVNNGENFGFTKDVDSIIAEFIKQTINAWSDGVENIFTAVKNTTLPVIKTEANPNTGIEQQADNAQHQVESANTQSSAATTAVARRVDNSIKARGGHMSLRGDRAAAVARSVKVLHAIDLLLNEAEKLSVSTETGEGLNNIILQLRTAKDNILKARPRPGESSNTTIDKFKEYTTAGKSLVDILKSGLNDPYGYNKILDRARIEDMALKAMNLDGIDFGNIEYDKQQAYLNESLPFIKALKSEMSKAANERNYELIQQQTQQLLAAIGSLSSGAPDTPYIYKKWGMVARADKALMKAGRFTADGENYDFHNRSNAEQVKQLVAAITILKEGLRRGYANEKAEREALATLNNAISTLNQIVGNETAYRKTPEYLKSQNYQAAQLITEFEDFKSSGEYRAFNEGGRFANEAKANEVAQKTQAVETKIRQINELLGNKDRTAEQNAELEQLIKEVDEQQTRLKDFVKQLTGEYDPAERAKRILSKGKIEARAEAAIAEFASVQASFDRNQYLTDKSDVYDANQKSEVYALRERAKNLVDKIKDNIKNDINGDANDTIKNDTAILTQTIKALNSYIDAGNSKLGAKKDDRKLNKISADISDYLSQHANIFKNENLSKEFLNLSNRIHRTGIVAADAELKFKDLKMQVKRAGLESVPIYKQLGNLVKQHFNTFLAMGAIHTAQRMMRQTFNNIMQIDSAMTELKKVTDTTQVAYENFFDSATSKAKRFGVTITEVINATSEFAKLGYSLPDASSMADAAIVYKNVGDGIKDIQTASASIIATIKAFDVPIKDTMEVVDVFNEIGNKFSITSAGTGQALEKSASALAQAGNSLSESVALIATANTTLQNPSIVGNALKTISLRLTKTKSELEALGEDTDFHIGTSSSYRNEILGLTGNKVDIMEADGETYKSTYQILKELSEVWDELSGKNQSALLYDLGGARQANALAAILNNFDIAEKALKAAENASGSALRENEKYLESIAGQMSILQSHMQVYSTQLLDDGVVKGILKIANAFAELATKITEVSSAWTPLAGIFAFALQSKNKLDVDKLISGAFTAVTSPQNTFKNVIDWIKGITAGQQNKINQRQKYGQIATMLSGLRASENAVDFIPSKKNKRKKSDRLIDQLLELGANNPDETELQELLKILPSASKKHLLPEEIEQYKAKLGKSADVYDGMSQGMGSFANNVIASFKAMAATMVVAAAITTATKIADKFIVTLDEAQDALDETQNEIESVEAEILQLQELNDANHGLTPGEKTRLDFLEEYKQSLKEVEVLQQRTLYNKKYNPGLGQTIVNFFTGDGEKGFTDAYAFLDTGDSDNNDKDDLYKTIDEYNDAKTLYDWASANGKEDQRVKYHKQMQSRATELVDFYTQVDTLKKNLEAENLEHQAAIDNGIVAGAEAEVTAGRIERNKETLSELGVILKDIEDMGLIELEVVLKGEDELYDFANAYSFTVNSIKEANSLGSSSEQIDEMQKAYETLINARNDYNKDGAYSLDTLQDLVNTDSRYIKYLEIEGNQLKLNAEGTEDLTNAMITQMRIQIATNTLNNMKAISELSAEEATEELNAAEANLAETMAGELDILQKQIVLYMTKEYRLNGNSDKYKLMEQALNSHNVMMLATNDILGKNNELLDDQRQKLEDNLRLRGDTFIKVIDDRIDALNDEIDAINKIYEAEDRELELQKKKNAYMAAQANRNVRLYTHDNGWQWVADPTKVKEAKEEYEEYLREVEKDKAIEALEDQIDKYEDLKDSVNDAMDHIGETLEEHMLEMELMAEFEAMSFDAMALAAEDYKNRVLSSLRSVKDELKGLGFDIPTDDVTIDPEDTKKPAYHADSADIMNGEKAYFEEQARTYGKWKGAFLEINDSIKETGQQIVDNTEETTDKTGEITEGFFSTETEKFTMFVGDVATGYTESAFVITENNKNIVDSYNKAAEAAANFFKTVQEESPTTNSIGIYVPDESDLPKFHSGGLIKKISPSSNISNQFLSYMERLQSDEVPAILQTEEFVLTKDMQRDILNDHQLMQNSIIKRGSESNSLSIGDIIINQPVGDTDSLSRAIVRQLPNKILKDIYKS